MFSTRLQIAENPGGVSIRVECMKWYVWSGGKTGFGPCVGLHESKAARRPGAIRTQREHPLFGRGVVPLLTRCLVQRCDSQGAVQPGNGNEYKHTGIHPREIGNLRQCQVNAFDKAFDE